MARKKYLHVSYVAGTGHGDYSFKGCLVTLETADYTKLNEVLKKDFCERTETPEEGLMLSIISLSEISKRTYKILNGGKL